MKNFSFKIDPLTGEEYYEVNLRGYGLLSDPLLNKGSHFTGEERKTLGLMGLLPMGVSDVSMMVARCMNALRHKPDDMERFIYLQGLLNRNETLFYRVLLENLDERGPVGRPCIDCCHHRFVRPAFSE